MQTNKILGFSWLVTELIEQMVVVLNKAIKNIILYSILK